MVKYMNDNKSIIKGLLVLLLYFILSCCTLLPLYLFKININSLNTITKYIYLLFYDLFSLSIIFLIFKNEIIDNFKNFKVKDFFEKYFSYWFLLLFLMFISNILIQFIYPNSSSSNEDNFRIAFSLAPIYYFIKASLFAPIMEELVFRMSIRKIFKNKYLFIILSGLIFGLLHIIGNISNNYDYLYLLPYCLPGFVLAYVYYKSDNILNSIFIHFIHNTILLIIQMVML